LSSSRGNGTAQRESVVPQPPSADRITVALIPKTGADLQRLQDRTGLSKTDIVNRAITLYEFIESQQHDGRDLLLRDQDTGELRTVLTI
jgi:predicted transcriptional regulator